MTAEKDTGQKVRVMRTICSHTLLSAICQPKTGITAEQFFEEWKRVGDVPLRLKQRAFETLQGTGKTISVPETHASRETEW